MLALRNTAATGARCIIVNSKSLVMVSQVEKGFEATETQLFQYLHLVRAMERHFAGFTLVHIPRAENMAADSLAKAVVQGEAMAQKYST